LRRDGTDPPRKRAGARAERHAARVRGANRRRSRMNRFGQRASVTDRTEQEAERRRARANQHLDRLRNRREPRTASRRGLTALPVPRAAWLLGALGTALVTGAWVGDDALAHLGRAGWHVSSVAVQGNSHLSGVEVAQAAGIAVGDGYAAADPRRLA